MKKIFIILLCLIVTLSLLSCNDTENKTDDITSENKDGSEADTSPKPDNFIPESADGPEADTSPKIDKFRPENADYSVITENGSSYIVFDDILKYNSTQDDQNQLATITFKSINELRSAITEGTLKDGQKRTMVSSFAKEGDRIKICDINNLYTPRLPKGFTVSEVYWAGEAYSFAIECGSTIGYIHYYPESDYQTIFENDYTNYFSKETITVNGTETLTDRNSTVTYYSTSMAELKQVRYILANSGLSVTVDETYTLSSSISWGTVPSESIPSNVTLYCSAKDVRYVVDIFGLTERPDEALLTSFLLTELENDNTLESESEGVLESVTEDQNDEMNTESDDTNNVVESPSGEMPLTTLVTEAQYNEFVSSRKMPDNFVYYDYISEFGSFKSLVFLRDTRIGDYGHYMYTLIAKDGFVIRLYVHEGPREGVQLEAISKKDGTDMRKIDSTENGIYCVGDLKYIYLLGKLSSIEWIDDGLDFTLSSDDGFDTYPVGENGTIDKLLDMTTCSKAFNNISFTSKE